MMAEDTRSPTPTGKKKMLIPFLIALFMFTFVLNCTIIYFILRAKQNRLMAEAEISAPDTLASVTTPDTAKIDTTVAIPETASVKKDTLKVDTSKVDTTMLATVTPAPAPSDTVSEAIPIDTAIIATPAEVIADTSTPEDLGRRVTRLVRIMDKMKPADSANVLSRLDDEFVVQILMRIKERNAAKILSSMPPARAARLSKLMTERAQS
jgi:hypothetical protein